MSGEILQGDCIEVLKTLAEEGVDCCVTSPPYYGLRDYHVAGQIGMEETIGEYIEKVVDVFREVKRVLKASGTAWVVIGDSYSGGGGYAPNAPCNQRRAEGEWGGPMHPFSPREGEARKSARPGYVPPGLKPKDLVGIPWRVAFALQADGWYLRSDIVWHKPNPMPESVTDRPTKSHEYVFLLSKNARYYYDAEAIKERISAASVVRLTQKTFDRQTGGPKDGINPNRSCRKALENLHNRDQRNEGIVPGKGESHATGTRAGKNLSDAYAGTDWGSVGVNKRDVWTIPTHPYADAHFATFPEKLVEIPILAGTSARGCCASCGAPWERVVEVTNSNGGVATRGHRFAKTESGEPMAGDHRIDVGAKDGVLEKRSAGWRKTCECMTDETKPSVVLDPFLGSGTTALVAQRLRRDYIGIELNPEYVEMARRRIANETPSLPLEAR